MKKRTILAFIIILILTFTAILLVKFVKIDCLVLQYTGYECLTCGFTRMVEEILNFNFKLAFTYNRVMFVSLPLFIYFFCENIISFIKKGKPNVKNIDLLAFFIILVALIIQMIYRN